MELALNADGTFTLKNAKYEMAGAKTSATSAPLPIKVGGSLPNGTMRFNVAIDKIPDFGKDGALLEVALPKDEPVAVSGGKKLTCGKAASLKYAKDKATGLYSLAGLDDPKKPNLSGLKLTYTPKTGVFKGSFKLYAAAEGAKPKLKSYKVDVIGFVVDGVGYGEATMKKPSAGPWTVIVK